MNAATKLKTSFRLSHAECLIIESGLMLLHIYLRTLDISTWDPILSEELKNLLETFHRAGRNVSSKTHRLMLDVWEISALIHCVKLLVKDSRRKPSKRLFITFPKNLNIPPAERLPKLLGTLEKHRKRAKRLWFRLGDTQAYHQRRTRWLQLLGGIRDVRKPVRLPRSPLEQFQINTTVKIAREVLVKAEEQLPTDRELRILVRKALRHVRRHRGEATNLDLVSGTPAGKWFLERFLVPRVRKLTGPRRKFVDSDQLFKVMFPDTDLSDD